MGVLRMTAEGLIDPETETHYAFHKSLKQITFIHCHDFFELFLITHGQVMHIINARREILPEGTFVFMRPDDVHSYEKIEGRDCELINLAFPRRTVLDLFNYLGKGFRPQRLLKPAMPPRLILSKSETALVKAKLEQLHTIPHTSKPERRTQLRILLVDFFSRYFSRRRTRIRKSIPDWLDWLLNEMHKKENFAQGVAAMQKLSRRSPEHLSRMFKTHLGATPTEFVNDLRLDYAANLLASTDETIAFIAMEAGFENLSHFYHLFKKRFNLPPKRFRAQNKKTAIP